MTIKQATRTNQRQYIQEVKIQSTIASTQHQFKTYHVQGVGQLPQKNGQSHNPEVGEAQHVRGRVLPKTSNIIYHLQTDQSSANVIKVSNPALFLCLPSAAGGELVHNCIFRVFWSFSQPFYSFAFYFKHFQNLIFSSAVFRCFSIWPSSNQS